jgi:hypothetical protein
MNVCYNIPMNLKSNVIENIVPSYGSTDALIVIFDTIKLNFGDKKINFIYPEASYPATISGAYTFDFNMLPIKKPTKHNFFITKKQIDNLKLN